MKPTVHTAPTGKRLFLAELASGQRRLPRTDYSFQSSIEDWRGFSSPYDGDDGADVRNFRNLNRELLAEVAREHVREMIVFGLVVITSAWPVIYMVVTVVKLLSKDHS